MKKQFSFRCSESGTEDSWQIIGVEAFIQRDDYDTLTHENDIAILRLVEDIIFNDIVAPVNLPDELITDETEIATIIGWGTTDPWVISSYNVKIKVFSNMILISF